MSSTCRLLQTLPKFAPEGTSLYIATNEDDPTFFHPLRQKYTIFTLSDFARLWGPGSEWHDAYSKLLRSDTPELDVYMQVRLAVCLHHMLLLDCTELFRSAFAAVRPAMAACSAGL